MKRKLTNKQVINIRSSTISSKELAKKYGMTPSAICNIRLGNRYQNVGIVAQNKGDYDIYTRMSKKDIKTIKYFLSRGYLNYGQLEKHFKVSRQTIYKLNEYGKRTEGKRPKFNGISFAYIKALYEINKNYREVAEAVNAKENTIYGLLTKERLSINYIDRYSYGRSD